MNLATLAIVAPGYESKTNAQYWLNQGIIQHSAQATLGNAYGLVIAYWAAHQIATTPTSGDEHLSIPTGAIAGEGAGSESVSYAVPTDATMSDFGSTVYGRKYLSLIKRANMTGTLIP